MIRIIAEDYTWKGKFLVFTWHFKEEFESINKPLSFILEILEFGEHILVSKRQNKYNVFYPFKGKFLCMSYVEHEKVILIHIKPIKSKPKERLK